ncbi:MAG TPA: hypothetical protein VF042_14040 [Gemmatimonadaceae bacterium]
MTSRRPAMVAAIAVELCSIGLALLFLAANDWFGAGDLSAMFVWTLPLAVLIHLTFERVLRRLPSGSKFRTHLTLVVVGGIAGFVWSVAAALMLGGWIAAFSFPVALWWLASAMFAGVVAAAVSDAKSWGMATVFTVAVVICGVALTNYASTPERQIRVVLSPASTQSDQDLFWNTVVGRSTGRSKGEHTLIDGIAGVGITGYERGQPVYTVSFRAHLSRDVSDSIIAEIRRSPLITRVDTLGRPER